MRHYVIVWRPGSGQHDDRDYTELGIVLDRGQRIQTAQPRHIDIEQNQVGKWNVPVTARPMQEVECVGTVQNKVQFM